MEDKITIIEGPPPNFEDVHEGWPLGLSECPSLHKLALTRLRTFNGPALVERCYQAWHKGQNIQLEFRAASAHLPVGTLYRAGSFNGIRYRRRPIRY
jgi:hypothetical protein